MKRYLARFQLVLDAPLHIGTGRASTTTDAPVHRDSFGLYRIPGTSLAGVLRAAVARSQHGLVLADELFGCMGENNAAARGSRLLISDGYLLDPDGQVALEKVLAGSSSSYPAQSAIQDCVRIDEETGTAAVGGKFDLEIVPEGTAFAVEIEYEPAAESDRIDVLKELLVDLKAGRLQLGGNTTRGLGFVSARDIALWAFDIDTPAGLQAWHDRPYGLRDPVPAQAQACPLDGRGLPGLSPPETVSGRVRIGFEADGPLLIGGGPTGLKAPQQADLTFLELPVVDYSDPKEFLKLKAVVPGSSLKGVMRHRAGEILRFVGRPDVKTTVDTLFGSIPAVGEDGTPKGKPQKGKLAVRGCIVQPQRYVTVQHVAIDRLTGSSLQGALYAEAPIWTSGVQLQIELRLDRVPLAQAALLAHVLLDMGQGRLPIGGGTRRGNGRLKFAQDPQGLAARAIHLELTVGQEIITHSDRERLETLLQAASERFAESFRKGG